MDVLAGPGPARARLRSLLAGEGWLGTPTRLLLGLAGLGLVRHAHPGGLPAGAARAILLYLGLTLLFTTGMAAGQRWTLWRKPGAADLWRVLLLAPSYVDLAFISLIVLHSGGPLSDAYLLYLLLAFRLALLYPALPEVAAIAILIGPAYAGVLYVLADGWFFLSDPLFLWRYLVLFATSLGSIGLGWHLARLGRRQRELEARFGAGRASVLGQTVALQQTVTDLGRRVRQLRTLQEGVKAINAALPLEDLLTLIVANASQVMRDARCALTLLDEDEATLVTQAVAGPPDNPTDLRPHGAPHQATHWALEAAQWVVEHGQPMRTDQATGQAASLICVPLMAESGPIGALCAISSEGDAFSAEDLEVLGAFADQAVTAVKTARFYSSVQERRAELEAMLRGIGDGVIATDARLRLTALNPVAAHILNVQRDLVAGQRLDEVIDNRDLENLASDTLAGGELHIREIALHNGAADQGPRFYQALASAVRGEGNEVRGVVIVVRDVTRQKELDQAKSDFMSVVSHELKTPLHSIKGFVDIILMGKTGPVSDRQRDFLETVRQQSLVLMNMISDLLEFSRLEAGRTSLRVEPVLFGQIVHGVVERLRPLAEEGDLQLINLVPRDFPPFEADLARLEQVVTNLCANAIKFTPAGSVTVGAADLGVQVQLSVSDTGIGIPTDRLERIFERFYQVDSSPTRSYRGAGLGLTICKHIVEYHSGRIWVESVEGQGSIFHVTLPKRQPTCERLAMDFSALPSRQPQDGS